MDVSKVKVGISRVASGLVFQTVNQALCVHRDVTRFLLWCGMDRSRTSFQILKLSNRVERELMDVVPSSRFCLLLVFTTTEGPARPLPSSTMHAAGASACPNVSTTTHILRAWVSAPHAQLDTASSASTYQTRLRDASDWLLTEQAHGGARQV